MRTASSKSPKLGQEAKSMLEKSMGSMVTEVAMRRLMVVGVMTRSGVGGSHQHFRYAPYS